MADWENKEGLIPEWELVKGLKGFAAWIILAIASLLVIWGPLFNGLAGSILHKYGSTMAIPDPDSILYFIVYPVMKYVCAIVFACIAKGVINKVIKNHNRTVERKNASILEKNMQDSVSEFTGNESEYLSMRLRKGKAEIEKYETFFKKKDFAHLFYHWKNWYAIIVAVVASIGTTAAAFVVVLIVGVIIDIVLLIMGMEASQSLIDGARTMVDILGCAAAVVVGLGSIPFAKKMQKRADKLQAEDEKNGYTAAVDRVIGDVPDRYRTGKVMGKLIKFVDKKGYTTVEEAIANYELDLKIKKGIALALAAIAIFGIIKGMNSICEDMENTGREITGDIAKSMDKSKAENERLRAEARRERTLRSEAAAKQTYADRSRTNAESLKGTAQAAEANQWANQHQREANEAWKNYYNR